MYHFFDFFLDYQYNVGSYNFTNAAEYKNAENIMIVESSEIAAKYLDNWHNRLNVSTPLQTVKYHDKAHP